jgi:hypothetical protein
MTRQHSKPYDLPRNPPLQRREEQSESLPQERYSARFRDPMRSGRMPRTLINGSTGANAATGVRAIAAAIHFRRPCYAMQLQRIGRALAEGVTEAGAIAAWTEKPVPLGSVADNVVSEASLDDTPPTDITLTEADWTTLGNPVV